MPISSEDLTRLGKSSLDLYLKNGVVDQIVQERPFLKMVFKGKKQFGGAKKDIVEQLRKDYGSNFNWAYGESKVQFNKRDTIEQASFPWRRAVDATYLTYDELFSNGIDVKEGKQGGYRLEMNEKVQLTNLLKETNEVLREGFFKSLDFNLHRDGSSSGDAVVGLDALISLNPTVGIVGGIDRASNAYWRNHADKTLTTANMLNQMEKGWRECVRHGGAPDYILCGSDFIDAYRAAVPITRNIDAKNVGQVEGSVGDGNRTGLYFKQRELLWDPTFDDLDTADSPAVPWSKRCYFINSKHLTWRDNGYEIITPQRPHDTLCMYLMINMRCALSLNKGNAHAVFSLA